MGVFRVTPGKIHAEYMQHEYKRSLLLILSGQDLCGIMQQYISLPGYSRCNTCIIDIHIYINERRCKQSQPVSVKYKYSLCTKIT